MVWARKLCAGILVCCLSLCSLAGCGEVSRPKELPEPVVRLTLTASTSSDEALRLVLDLFAEKAAEYSEGSLRVEFNEEMAGGDIVVVPYDTVNGLPGMGMLNATFLYASYSHASYGLNSEKALEIVGMKLGSAYNMKPLNALIRQGEVFLWSGNGEFELNTEEAFPAAYFDTEPDGLVLAPFLETERVDQIVLAVEEQKISGTIGTASQLADPDICRTARLLIDLPVFLQADWLCIRQEAYDSLSAFQQAALMQAALVARSAHDTGVAERQESGIQLLEDNGLGVIQTVERDEVRQYMNRLWSLHGEAEGWSRSLFLVLEGYYRA